MLPAQPANDVEPAPLFSQIEDDYLAIRADGGASAGTISTARWRASVFKTLAGDRPLDHYMPIDLQNYVNELQYLPLQFSQKGEKTEELLAMGIGSAVYAVMSEDALAIADARTEDRSHLRPLHRAGRED